MCTQTIVDTMLKETEISGYPARRSHRTYTPEFKSQLVAACQQPGVSIAALAGQHGMNANVLHRWLKEHQRNGCHRLLAQPGSKSRLAEFVSIPLTTPMPTPADHGQSQEIRIELRKGALTLVLTWPAQRAADLANWTAAVLK